ncbi:18548_t:CDS:2 [Entrophospora sp. SA101]|nr:18548_t:CDS:2 [Entrophospora sp. SA101]
MLDPVLEQNYPTNPKRVDKHDRGQILLTINVEFEDGHTQAICVHVNDEPADLAKDFCDLWGVTNPVVEPAFEGLIKEEKDKRLVQKRPVRWIIVVEIVNEPDSIMDIRLSHSDKILCNKLKEKREKNYSL